MTEDIYIVIMVIGLYAFNLLKIREKTYAVKLPCFSNLCSLMYSYSKSKCQNTIIYLFTRALYILPGIFCLLYRIGRLTTSYYVSPTENNEDKHFHRKDQSDYNILVF